MMLVDSHCHLDFPDFADLDGVLARANAAGVGRFITISTEVARADVYRNLAESHRQIFFSIGTHPNHVNEEPGATIDQLVSLSAHPKCVAIGEAGLDYHYDKVPRELAAQVLRRHIAAARIAALPLVIHSRDADADMAAILEDEMGKGAFPALLHCFTSSRALAETGLRLGLYVSFSGVLTFKNSEDLRAIARDVPLDRLLVETDAPYLAPTPYRGKRNEPAYVAETAKVLASVKGVSAAALAEATTANVLRLFGKISKFEAAA
jgi:TatD DNase family protein